MIEFDPNHYGPVFAALVDVDRRRQLGAGNADEAAREKLDALSIEAAFAGHPHLATASSEQPGPLPKGEGVRVVDREMAACCVAGVWLLHDFLDESHMISQGIETPSGSYWHAIMHRREGDFWNSKYWYRRGGRHPVLEKVAAGFDPLAFVDECEAAVEGRGDRERCLDVQQREWEVLFDFCYRGAIGGAPAR